MVTECLLLYKPMSTYLDVLHTFFKLIDFCASVSLQIDGLTWSGTIPSTFSRDAVDYTREALARC